MDNCTIDCIQVIGNFSRSDTCQFVQDNCDQDTVQIIQGYYCVMGESFILLILLLSLFLLMLYYALQHLTDNYLAPTVEEFIHTWHVSDALAGITFLAFANGAPDIVTAIVAGASTSDSTALIPFGSLYGAAIFDMAFILSRVIQLLPSGELSLKKREVLVPLCFYIGGTIYLLMVSLFYKKMNLAIAAAFLALYAVYIVVVIFEERNKHKKKKFNAEQSLLEMEGVEEASSESNQLQAKMEEVYAQNQAEEDNKDAKRNKNPLELLTSGIRKLWNFVFHYGVPPFNGQSWQPVKAVTSLVLAPFVCLLSYGPSDSFDDHIAGIPLMVWFSVPAVVFLLHTIFCIVKKRKPQMTILYSIYAFVIVVTWLALICSVLINILELLQLLTNINSVFLGLSVISWANCVGDYLSITTFAKKGYASTAVAGIFSGQLTNFLLGFGLSLFMRSTRGEYDFALFDFGDSTYDRISDSIIMVVIGLSMVYMVWLGIRLWAKRGSFGPAQGRIAKIYYVTFITVALVISVCTDFFREVSCDLSL